MKGIVDLGVINIPLKPNVKPIKQIMKEELDKMITIGIIKPVEESEWVSPMVVQENKAKGEIIICVDLRKLNDACQHDPFPTPFIEKLLDNVGG